MNMQEAIKKLEELQRKMFALDFASGLISYDSQTHAPEDSADSRGEALAELSGFSYQVFANPKTEELLAALKENEGELDELQRRQAELLKRDYDQMSKVPQEEYTAFSKLVNEAENVWQTAKRNNDYPAFAPYIQKIADTLRAFAGYYDPKAKPYDVWLDQFERGLDMKQADAFFEQLQETIVPLVKRIQEEGAPIDDSFLHQDFPIEKQKQLSEYLMEVMTIDPKRCTISQSEHPFTTDFSKHDVRITTHYYENQMTSSMYSVIHEGGHALYELNVADELMYTCTTGGVSMGVHESQSRLFENLIGRSEPFIQLIYPKLQELFPTQLSGVTDQQFYRAVNKCQPSLIRIEADELTYSLHIMIRYEIEKLLLEGKASQQELPELWAELTKKYLGIHTPDDAHGVLQDSHWSGGSMGYFPSYAIGSAYSAQIMDTMRQDLNVDGLIRKGDLKPIVAWLTDKIYRFGKRMDPSDLIRHACGKPFDPSYYTDYLTKKFKKIYELD